MTQNSSRGFKTPGIKRGMLFEPKPIPLHAHVSGVNNSDSCNISDLWALFQVPWSIEIWLVSPGGQRIQLPVNTFVDCVHKTESSYGRTAMRVIYENGIFASNVRITAVPIAGQNHQIPEDATIYACISIGDMIMDQSGELDPSPQCGGGFGTVAASSADDIKLKHMNDQDSNNPNVRSNAKLPWNDPRWVRCEPEYRSTVLADLWDESSSTSKGRSSPERKQFSVCPGGECAASFGFAVSMDEDEKASAPTNSANQLSASDVRASKQGVTGRFNASRTDSSRSEHNVINPLFAASLKQGGSMKFKNIDSNPPLPLSDLSQPSSPASSSSRPTNFVVPDSTTIALDSVSFHVALVPERSAGPSPPAQFYGQLAKTEIGAEILSASDHLTTLIHHISTSSIQNNNDTPCNFERQHLCSFGSFINSLSQNTEGVVSTAGETVTDASLKMRTSSGIMSSSSSTMVIRRAFLWIIGNIGSSVHGLEVLLKHRENIITDEPSCG
eukprot:CAMPEP_0204894662 /NCGR_PEP_ID=MMETSP1349-20130617/33544_1 /ASSEMBLY_ACC=CAM_ASM_000710 /TAXON_ID=215587 /ORGANISM="Aplanochytrium stocchinoi, Strain GSBS06" /LENGTH=498 /DNA_ID=CAMNT_0052061855 /DNA_START=135 /DNA_END=1631 /DNA_ORIENTATION=-